MNWGGTPRYSWNTAKVGVKQQPINQSYIATDGSK
jgi:hypothetical protein